MCSPGLLVIHAVFFCVPVVCYKSDFPVSQHIIGLILKQMVKVRF